MNRTFFHVAFLMSNWLLLVTVTASQAPSASVQMTEVDPIRCWWRTSEGAVAVGQPFSVVLTCAVLESDSVRVVPDEAPLAIGSVQLAPFELIRGSHPADLRSGQRRFFQYEYSVRLIDPTAIDRDVKLPEMVIHYRVESRVQSQSLEGRDRTYVLPPHAVHIVSMVPADASDIRDASNEHFGTIEALRFRARVLNVAAVSLTALGLILLIPAVARVLTGARRRSRTGHHALPDRTVLSGVTEELTAVQRESGSGWTPDLVARALTAIRVASAYALGRRVSQRAMTDQNAATEARLVVGSRRGRFGVSSPVTAGDVARELERLPLTTPQEQRQAIETLQKALSTLSRALYSQDAGADADKDEAVGSAIPAVQHIRSRKRR